MTYLPIDYYILLQKGYDREKDDPSKAGPLSDSELLKSFPRTNLLMFRNLPIFSKKNTFYNKTSKFIKAVTFEDVYRCLEKSEAKKMLTDTTAEAELQKWLKEYFGGSVERVELINYDPERLVDSFHSP